MALCPPRFGFACMTAKIFLLDEAWEKDCFFLFVVGDRCDVIYKYLCCKTLQGQERKAWGLILLSQTPVCEHLKMLTLQMFQRPCP